MSITKVARLVSDGNIYVRPTRKYAINALLDELFSDQQTVKGAIKLISIPTSYPILRQYINDDSPLSTINDNPSFIWDLDNQPSGQPRGFATGFITKMDAASLHSFTVFLQMFADNSINFSINIYDADKQNVLNITPTEGLTVGNTDATAGLYEPRHPFGWQNIRYYSHSFDFETPVTNSDIYAFVVSIDVEHYFPTNGAFFNPAALAFVADFYRLSSKTSTP